MFTAPSQRTHRIRLVAALAGVTAATLLSACSSGASGSSADKHQLVGLRVAALPFRHGTRYEAGELRIFPSYHCSRYNTNTGVLTEEMFVSVFADVASFLG